MRGVGGRGWGISGLEGVSEGGGMVRRLQYRISIVHRLRSGGRDGESWFIIYCLLFIPRCTVQRLY